MIKVSQEKIEQIIARYSAGESSEKIAKDLSINGSTVCRILKRSGISIRPAKENKLKYPNLAFDYFSKIDSPDKSYFLGFMMSDGNVSKDRSLVKIEILSKDKKILSILSGKIYGFDKVVCKIIPKTGHETSRLSINSDRMRQDLINLGCVPNKTWKIEWRKFPFMSHFLRGYLDGDGCISVSPTRCRVIFTCNENFATGLQNFLESNLQIKSSIYRYKRTKAVDLTISNINQCCKFLNFVYDGCEDYFLNRKFQKYLEVLNFKR